MGSTPERTCVGCRARGPKPELIRVALIGGKPVVDVGARMPGRGAYLHPGIDCAKLAARTGALARALRAAISAGELSNLLRAIEGVS